MSVLELIPGKKPESAEQPDGLLDSIKNYLRDDDWNYLQDEDKSAFLHLVVNGKNARFSCSISTIQEKDLVSFFVYVASKAPEGRRKEVMEFITRVNFGTYIGNFEMNMEDGSIRYKVSIDVEAGILSAAMLKNMMMAGLNTVDRYYLGLMEVMYSHAIPAVAVREIEG